MFSLKCKNKDSVFWNLSSLNFDVRTIIVYEVFRSYSIQRIKTVKILSVITKKNVIAWPSEIAYRFGCFTLPAIVDKIFSLRLVGFDKLRLNCKLTFSWTNFSILHSKRAGEELYFGITPSSKLVQNDSRIQKFEKRLKLLEKWTSSSWKLLDSTSKISSS